MPANLDALYLGQAEDGRHLFFIQQGDRPSSLKEAAQFVDEEAIITSSGVLVHIDSVVNEDESHTLTRFRVRMALAYGFIGYKAGEISLD